MAATELKQQHQQHQQQGGVVVCGSRMVRVLMVLLALGLSVYTIAPAVYWHVVAEDGDVLTQWVLQCPPCPASDCTNTSPSPDFLADSASKLLGLAQKLNSTPTDCHGSNRCMKESMAQTQEHLQREGLKLQKEAKTAQQRASSAAYEDASKKTVYPTARTMPDKVSSAQEARAEAELAKETTRANVWEKRARDLGWKAKATGYQKYKKYIQMLDG